MEMEIEVLKKFNGHTTSHLEHEFIIRQSTHDVFLLSTWCLFKWYFSLINVQRCLVTLRPFM